MYKKNYTKMLKYLTFMVLLMNNISLQSAESFSQLRKAVEEARQLSPRSWAAEKLPQSFEKYKTLFNTWKTKDQRVRQKDYGNALRDVGKGTSKIIAGARSGDKLDIVAGVLDIAAGLVALAMPYGPIFSGVLSLISSFIGIFNTKPSMGEIFRKEIQAYGDEQLRLKVKKEEGDFQRLHSAVKDGRKALEECDKTENRQQCHETAQKIANSYQEAFLTKGDELKAHFERRKIDYCNTIDKESDNIKKCGDFLGMYCDYSITRHMAMIDLASFLCVSGDDHMSRILGGALLLIRRRDRDFLKFLVDPFGTSHGNRIAASIFWQNPWHYGSCFQYIITLEKEARKVRVPFFAKYITLCSDTYLQGECVYANIDEVTEYFKKKTLYTKGATSSAFIPFGFSLQTGSRNYIGPDLRFTLFDATSHTSREKSGNGPENEFNYALDMVKLCSYDIESRYKSKFVDSACIPVPVDNYTSLDSFTTSNYKLYKSVGKIFIPSGLKLTAYTKKDYGGDPIGPIYGRVYMGKVCRGNEWASIKIEQVISNSEKSGNMIKLATEVPPSTIGESNVIIGQKQVCFPTDENKEKESWEETGAINVTNLQGCAMATPVKYLNVPIDTKVFGQNAAKKYLNMEIGDGVALKHQIQTWKNFIYEAKCKPDPTDEEE